MTNELGQGTAVIPWDAVERAYQTTNVPVTQLARDFAIPSSALLDRIKRYGWKRSNCAAAPPRANHPGCWRQGSPKLRGASLPRSSGG